ncbi:MAG: tetratricopeptide repeat protein [Oligoflexia bacterium]|nr:tetratricopeptide repeat protein [Oligoflexia bacterium]
MRKKIDGLCIRLVGLGLFVVLVVLSSCNFMPDLHEEIFIAQKSARDENYQRSIKLYEDLLRKNPPIKIKEKIFFRLSELYAFHVGDNLKAVRYLEQLRKETEDPAWLVKVEERLGEIRFVQLKDFKKAKDNYTNLVNFRPKLERNDFYEFRLAQAYLESGDLQGSLKIFRKIVDEKNHQYSLDALYFIGLAYFQIANWDQALFFWQDYVAKEKSREKIAEVKFFMGNIYETKEKFDLAYETYYSIIGDYPNTDVLKSRIKSLVDRVQKKS